MAKKIKRKRFSVVTSLLAASVVFPPACCVAAVTVRALLIAVADGLHAAGIQIAAPADTILIGMMIGLPLLTAYLAARVTYKLMRWETIDDPEGRFCEHCGYDLTGNGSGRCPECGTAVQGGQPGQHASGGDRGETPR